jgi:hypothetical protein
MGVKQSRDDVVIDDELLDEAMSASAAKTKKQIITTDITGSFATLIMGALASIILTLGWSKSVWRLPVMMKIRPTKGASKVTSCDMELCPHSSLGSLNGNTTKPIVLLIGCELPCIIVPSGWHRALHTFQ